MIKSLKTYQDWKHCITVLCGIPLTESYIEERLASLRDPTEYGTQKFVKLWGEPEYVGRFETLRRQLCVPNPPVDHVFVDTAGVSLDCDKL